LIKINLVREGRAAVRGAAATPGAPAAAAGGPSSINNMLLLAGIVLGLLLAGGYYLVKNRELATKRDQIEVQKQEAQRLEKIIKEVADFQKRKDALEKRINLINQLKQNQKGPVRLLDQISRDLPDLVWLDKMTVDGVKISLTGRALNPNAFANYVENIKHDPMFDEPEVGGVREEGSSANGPTVYGWNMNFNFKWNPAGASGAAGGTGTTDATGTDGASGAGATAAPQG
jgi:type IV pilus assembly protein PilN